MQGSFSKLYMGGSSTALIERNIFLGFNDIEVNYGSNVSMRNNVFFDQLGVFAIQSHNADILAEYNSFLSTDRIALKLLENGRMTAMNNFWNTTNTNIIDSMILTEMMI